MHAAQRIYIVSIFVRFMIFSFLGDKRNVRIKYMLQGLLHGFLNKNGSYYQ